MKHTSSRALYAYWHTQRGTRAAPERGDVDPGAIRHVLSDMFMLSADFADEHRFRLAGTKICTLFGRELKDRAFLDLCDPVSRAAVADLLTVVSDEAAAVIAGATGYTEDGASVGLELLLLPLARRGHARVRALGVLAPLEHPYWLGTYPLTSIKLGATRHLTDGEIELAPAEPPPLATSAVGGRMRHGFMVVDGGLAQRETV